jgi:peptidoglycan LD-endopeptidase CwlK
MTLSQRSLSNLEGVHPDLVRVVKRAYEIEPFIVTQGLRTLAQQKENIAKGVSWTLKSRHLSGHAVDVCDQDGCYDLPDMMRVGKAFKQAGAELGIPIIWGAQKQYGGDWSKRNDTPHFELPAKVYPANPGIPVTDQLAQAAKVAGSARAVGGVVVGTGATAAVTETAPSLPSIPAPPDLSGITAWQSTAETVGNSVNWVSTNVTAALLVVGYIGVTVYWTTVWPPVKAFLAKWRAA